MRIQGIVLAGGKSNRFGDDKALALVEGVPMIQRAVELLMVLKIDPCVITNASRDYSFLKCRIENDLIPGKGPLGGIDTAFSKFKQCALLILVCDMPLVSCEMLRTLKQVHTSSNKVTLYQDKDGTPEPFPGIYDPSLKLLVQDCIRSDKLSMHEFIQRIKRKKILPVLFDRTVFANINSKRDFQRASQAMKSEQNDPRRPLFKPTSN